MTRYRFGEEKPAATKQDARTANSGVVAGACWTSLNSDTFKHVAQGLEVLLWSLLTGPGRLLIWRYREWLQHLCQPARATPGKKHAKPVPAQLFGLELGTETLPDDIASTAEQLWPTQPREALGLLYRGLLSRLLHDYQLPLKSADTEGQVLERVHRLQQPQLLAFSEELTRHWQNLAYGHRLPPPRPSRNYVTIGVRCSVRGRPMNRATASG